MRFAGVLEHGPAVRSRKGLLYALGYLLIVPIAWPLGVVMRRRPDHGELARGDALRVLLVAAANSVSGGGERHVADLMRRLPAHGIEVGLAAPAGGDLGALAKELECQTYDVPIASGLLGQASGRCAWRSIGGSWPDLVHAHGSRAAAFARLADPHAAERVIYTVHGIHIDKAGSAARRSAFLRARALSEARDGAVHHGRQVGCPEGRAPRVCSRPTARRPSTTGSSCPRLRVAADLPARDRHERGPELVLSIGRFHEQKDQMTLLARLGDWSPRRAPTRDSRSSALGTWRASCEPGRMALGVNPSS